MIRIENTLKTITMKIGRATILPAAIALMLLAFSMPALAAHAQPTPTLLQSLPIVGNVLNGVFAGTGTLTNLGLTSNRMLTVNGLLNGVIQLVNGTLLPFSGVFSAVGSILRDPSSGNCTILHLNLGPINLNLLGLVLTTSPITIDLTAVSGPGNLLGNLLCSVAHLLDNNGPLTAIQTLLNRINTILSGL